MADRGLVFFAGVVALQAGHIVEHLVQLFQLFVLQQAPAQSHGIIGRLDIEWVHFVWNLGTLGVIWYLLSRYRDNGWVRAAFLIAVWHQIEHIYVFTVYLATGVAGDPGLLAKGGAMWGGLPLSRPVLHALYNIIETAPLAVGLFYQWRRSSQGISPSVTAAERS